MDDSSLDEIPAEGTEEAGAVRRPYVAGSQALLDKHPRRRDDIEDGVTVETEQPPRCVLLHPDEGRYLELSPWEAEFWRQLDGTRTVRELLQQALRATPPVGPERVGQALLRFAREGLLTGQWGVPRKSRRELLRRRIEAQPELDAAFRMFVGFFLAFLPLAGVPFLAMLLWNRGLHTIPPGGSLWGILLATVVLVQWRQLLLGCSVLLSGRDIPSWGLRVAGAIPSVFFDTSSMLLATKKARLRVHLAGIYGTLALGAMAALAMQMHPMPLPESFLLQLIIVSLVGFVVDVSPVYDTDGYEIYRLLLGQPHLRDRAFTFMSRRLTAKLTGERFGRDDRALLTFGVTSLLWAVGGLAVALYLYRDLFACLPPQFLAQGPAPERAALAVAMAAVLGGAFYALGLLLWIPISWFVRPLGRRALVTLVTPFTLALSLGLLLFCGPETARLVCGASAFIAMFPLLRARKTFKGAPVCRAMFALGAYGGFQALAIAAGPAGQAGWLPGWPAIEPAVGLTARLSSLLLLLAAWALREESRLMTARPGEIALVRGLWAALLGVAGIGLWMRGGLCGWLDALELIAGTGAAISALPLVLAHCGSPARQFWRPLALGLLALAAAGAAQFVLEAGPGMAELSLRWQAAAWPLTIAAAVASRAWCDRRWRKVSSSLRPANASGSERGMLLIASQVLISSMVGLFETGLGPRKSESLVRSINRDLELTFRGQVMLLGRELDVVGWENHDLDWLTTLLKRSFETLESRMMLFAGRRFTDWARNTALEELYWFEQELLRHCLPETFPVAAEEMSAGDRLEEISKVPFFAVLDEPEFGALMRVIRLERVQAGERIIRQGEPADRFYVVARGELTVIREDESGHEEPLGHLLGGDCFGESAFVANGRRTASVVASEDVELYTLGRQDLECLMVSGDRIAQALDMLVRYGGFLRNIPLLSVLPSAEVGKLAAQLFLEDIPANKTILRPGDPITGLHLVQDGRLALYSTGKKGSKDRQTTLSTGQHHGESALLSEETAQASLVTEVRSRVLFLRRTDFTRVMDEFLSTYTTLEDLATPRAELF